MTYITTMAYQSRPDSIIWATLADGTLISCTLEKEQNVVAWARHPLPLGAVGDAGTAYYTPPVSTDYPLLRTTTAQDDPQLQHVLAISNVEELQNITANRAGNYYLTNDIDATATSTWNAGEGFIPVSTTAAPFTGTFDGCGYTISNLYAVRNDDYQGLFGEIQGPAKVANVTLSNVQITGGKYCGALAGYLDAYNVTEDVLIQNCHASGIIETQGDVTPLYIGGLIGWARGTSADYRCYIYDCSTSCEVDCESGGTAIQVTPVGGFAALISHSTVINCSATGNVTGTDTGATNVGGFVGYVDSGAATGTSEISYCHATGDVLGEYPVGGFVGNQTGNGFIRKCYATGAVTCSGTDPDGVGGFAGQQEDTAEITDCYARGDVVMEDSGSDTGGFIGSNAANTTVDNSYSTGLVTSDGTDVGGFSGRVPGTNITNCYWDTETSGQATSDGDETGYGTTLMKTKTTFTDWDFDTIWEMAGTVLWGDTSLSLGANSVCVIPGTTEDEVWVSVGRSINGVLVRYIERMKPRDWGDDQEDCFFVDSGLSYDDTPDSTFSGLDHLEGETVAILGDGAVFPTQVVSDGAITLPETVSVCHIGLPFKYIAKPMRMDQSYNGTSKGSIKKITEAVISFYKTLNAQHSDGTTAHDIKWRTTEALGTPPDLFTGDKVVVADGGFDVEDPFQVEGSDPLPCTVRAIIPRLDVTGR